MKPWRIGIVVLKDGSLQSKMNPEHPHVYCVHRVTAKLGSQAVALAKREHRAGKCPGVGKTATKMRTPR